MNKLPAEYWKEKETGTDNEIEKDGERKKVRKWEKNISYEFYKNEMSKKYKNNRGCYFSFKFSKNILMLHTGAVQCCCAMDCIICSLEIKMIEKYQNTCQKKYIW